MKFYVYHVSNDYLLTTLSLFSNPNVIAMDLRCVLNEYDCYNSVVLLSDHSSNHKVTQLIRRYNVLIPIYIISDYDTYIPGLNGTICPQDLNYSNICNLLTSYPQKQIWDYVFKKDNLNRVAV